MSDFVLAEGFGNLSDGTHTAGSTREILGRQWTSYTNNFAIEDIGDGRKWIKNDGTARKVGLYGALGGLTTVAFCFRVIRPEGIARVLAAVYGSSTAIFAIGFSASGEIQVIRGSDYSFGTVVATGSVIPQDTETHVEVRVVIHDSTGSVSIYINGVEDTVVPNIDTKYSTDSSATVLRLWGPEETTELRTGWKFTDFIVHTGTSPLGDTGVFYVEADADGTDTDFTPSAGTNESCVDEIGPDEDTTYNESDGTAGHRDSFTTAGISGVTVLSVGTLVRARKTDTGAATLLLGAVHSASEDQGSAIGLSEDYLTYVEYFDTCPSTAAAWTPAQVTAAELSYEVGA